MEVWSLVWWPQPWLSPQSRLSAGSSPTTLPWDALAYSTSCVWPHCTEEQRPSVLLGLPERLDTSSRERTGTPPAPYQVLCNCWSTKQTSASQEKEFICLKCKPKKSVTTFRTRTRRENNSGLHSCLAYSFGFELCSLLLTDELLLKVIHVSYQPGVQFFQAASLPIATCFTFISDNPNAF